LEVSGECPHWLDLVYGLLIDICEATVKLEKGLRRVERILAKVPVLGDP